MIVYVDDEPMLCRVFALILQRTGAEVRTFTDPHEALAFLSENPVHAVVVDYRMPQMTGIELLRRLEQDVPVYMVSGDLGFARTLAEDPRIQGVLAKPFRPEALLELLAPHIP